MKRGSHWYNYFILGVHTQDLGLNPDSVLKDDYNRFEGLFGVARIDPSLAYYKVSALGTFL